MIRINKHLQVLVVMVALMCFSTSIWADADVSALLNAAYDGDLSQVKLLLAAKVDVNAKKDDDGTTPL